MQAIKTEMRKAKKEHYCGLCRGKINPDEKYCYQFIVDGRDSWGFKSHEKCDYIARELWSWFETDDGMTDTDFEETLPEYTCGFICPHCENFDCNKECKAELNGGTDCIDRIYDRLLKHRLSRVSGRYDMPKWVEVERESEGEK